METTSENRYISNSLKEALASIYGQAVTGLSFLLSEGFFPSLGRQNITLTRA